MKSLRECLCLSLCLMAGFGFIVWIATTYHTPRLMACKKSDKTWVYNITRLECKKIKGRWLPKGDEI